MLDKNIITSIKEKINNSKEFASSQTHRKLLEYLIQSYLDDVDVKETTIASDLFERNLDSDSNEDPIVRVHMYNLRLKLDSYYDHEGKDDKYRLEIPKGHYSLKFSPVSKIKNVTKSKLIRICAIIIIILLSSLILYLWYYTHSIKKQLIDYTVLDEENIIWKEFLQSDLQTLIVLGDHLFFSEYDNDMEKWRYIRDLYINSMEDFEAFKKLYPDKILKSSADSYFPDGSIWSLPPVLSVLYPVQKHIILERITNLTPQMLHESNIIFLGSIKTLGLFNRYLSSSNIEYQLNPNYIFYKQDNDTLIDTLETHFDQSSGYHKDYAIALKFPGPNNNVILIITSFFSSGVPELAKYLTNPSSIAQLEEIFIKKYSRVSQYFGIIAEVRGVEKTGLYLEIKHLNDINEKVKIW
jgi:hypothetical protein